MQRIQPEPGNMWVTPQATGAALMFSYVSDGCGGDAGVYPQERTGPVISFHSCDQPSLINCKLH